MFLDVTKMVRDIDGEVMEFNGKPLSFSRAICASLGSGGTEPTSMEDKIKKFKLAMKIQDAMMPVELTIEDAALIKEMVNKFFVSPLVVAPICIALEEAANTPLGHPISQGGHAKNGNGNHAN